MSDDTYTTIAGMVQFDVEEREVNGGDVRDVTIRSLSSGDLIRCTVWPEFADTEIERGDFVVIDGKVTEREHKGKVYFNVSARRLAVLPQAIAAERETESASSSSSSKRKTF